MQDADEKNTSRHSQGDERALLQAGYRYGLALTHDHHDAQDLVQDAWLRLDRARSAGRLANRQGDGERAYFLTIVRNLFIDSHRRGRLLNLESLAGDVPAPEVQDAPTFSRAPDPAEIHAALGQLSPAEREAIYLNTYEGLSAAAIAEQTGLARGTILSRMQRGKEKLARILQPGQSRSSGGTPQ